MCASRWKTVGDLPLPASMCLTLSLCLIHLIRRKCMRVAQGVKCVSWKQRTVCSAAHLRFSNKKCLLLLFFIAVIYDWSSHLIYLEWVCVCVPIHSLAPCLLSGMKSVCSQRSYGPVSGSIARPHKFTKVHMFHQAQSVQTTHTHTHSHAYTHRSLVGISLRLWLPTAAGHFNDVTF